ncbi:hypothetical protein Tco_0876577 [Tanacetum coccineum]|uniref:Uncharacterized protein n=1 Tax=Tanacetum coccineum TaxID=301880 RepID=A0ABQ5BSL9_9ASTR
MVLLMAVSHPVEANLLLIETFPDHHVSVGGHAYLYQNDCFTSVDVFKPKTSSRKSKITLRHTHQLGWISAEDMDSESAHMVVASKVPMLKPKNGNTTPKTTVVEGVEKVIPPTTAKEKA